MRAAPKPCRAVARLARPRTSRRTAYVRSPHGVASPSFACSSVSRVTRVAAAVRRFPSSTAARSQKVARTGPEAIEAAWWPF